GRRKQGPPPVQGTHDAEGGGLCSRARSRLGQAQFRCLILRMIMMRINI
ncbi:hypothetical protein A2U01_0081290, partial [Trifolium medium]|nr:hypothetical protein [Trifolium medium]